MRLKQFFVNFFIFVVFFSTSLFADTKLPTYDQVPEFSFTERSGREVALSDLKGKVWIADFIFTRCQGMCPMLTGRMAMLQQKMRTFNIQFVSFSVDPEYDTPKILSKYAAHYGADKNQWFFLTGSKVEMWKFITEGFSLGVAEPTAEDLKAGAEAVMHSARFVLVDAEGTIRGYYDSSEPVDLEQLIQDAARLASTVPGTAGTGSPNPPNLPRNVPGTVNMSMFPPLNAGLNATSGFLIILGFILIKQRAWTGHALCMCLALLVSAIFLVSYLYYHYHHGSTPFPHHGWIRPVYFSILISHTILAVTVLPLASVTLYQALRSRFEKHVKIAKITFPVWLYVSITGVVIYWMLYRM